MGTKQGAFPDRDITCMLKFGQSRCESLYCPASACECVRGGKVKTLEGSWGGMCSMKAICFASCRSVRKRVEEKALRKGTETFTWFYLEAAFSLDLIMSFRNT